LEALNAPRDPLFLIVDPDGAEPTDWCSGPDANGDCPRAAAGNVVPCAGRELVAVHGDLGPMLRRMVCAREDECPLPIMLAGGG
jgi:hypothetical protein